MLAGDTPRAGKTTLIAALIWLLVVLSGGLVMARYSQTAGDPGSPPKHWPEALPPPGDSALPRLVFFLHPHCPCSRATLGELERLMAGCQGLVTVHVWFIQPESLDAEWVKTDLWHTAVAIPGVEVHVDHEGKTAALFHSMTSGQALLYDPAGSLLFHGGITPARGHAGDNAGSDAINNLLKNRSQSLASTPVFGCALSRDQKTKECTQCQP